MKHIMKTSGPDFDEEGVEMVKYFCEEWGKIWPVLFPQRNITPKGHIMAFVLPIFVEEHRTFFKFIRKKRKVNPKCAMLLMLT